MEGNFVKASSKNTNGKVTFYIFEFAALAVFAIYFILGIIFAAKSSSFAVFVEAFVQSIFYGLVLYGLGRLIDLKLAKADCCEKKEEKKAPAKKEEK